MKKETGIDILAEIVEMRIIPGLKKTSGPSEVLHLLGQFLLENMNSLKIRKEPDWQKLSVLSDEEREIIEAIRADYTQAFDREKTVIEIMTRQCGLVEVVRIGILCEIIRKLTDYPLCALTVLDRSQFSLVTPEESFQYRSMTELPRVKMDLPRKKPIITAKKG